ncbi:MAG: hypothetical protein IKI09_00990 [Bacteroidales bacterium]|nr:hypothetical protein [Bacteroidales bacterium]
MSTNQKLRKFGGISLIVTALLLAFMPSCGKKGTTKGPEMFVERIQPLNEAMLALLDSYTSGIIAAGEPVMVRFNNPATLKVKYGEPIPAKAFDFKPALKGKAVWIDENPSVSSTTTSTRTRTMSASSRWPTSWMCLPTSNLSLALACADRISASSRCNPFAPPTMI